MINLFYYDAIFKRKSFHIFKNTGEECISIQELNGIEETFRNLAPLVPDIKTSIQIVPASATNCKRGEEYCILFYSEKKDNYLQNIGYLGEQLELYLVSNNIGTLWFGIGKIEEKSRDGLEFVIMMAIAKIDDEKKFRKNMFKSKRKEIREIWQGEYVKELADIVRFAPSACNTQPWLVKQDDDLLMVYRYKKPGKRGIMPAEKVSYYNQIDIGIFLSFMDLCLSHFQIPYQRELKHDNGGEAEMTLAAVYHLIQNDAKKQEGDDKLC